MAGTSTGGDRVPPVPRAVQQTRPEEPKVYRKKPRRGGVGICDMWSNAFAYEVGVATGYERGTFASIRPGWKGDLLTNVTRIDCPTPWVELRSRVHVVNQADLAEAKKVSDAVTVKGLEAYTGGTAPPVMASPTGHWIDAQTDRTCRVKVAADLSGPGRPDIFVIGDTALVLDEDGKSLPGVAPVARQQGKYVADVLIARARGNPVPRFHYRDFSAMATIVRKRYRPNRSLAAVQQHGSLWSLSTSTS